MPITATFSGLKGTADETAAYETGALDGRQVVMQFLCTTNDETGAHDPHLPPAPHCRPMHAALHGTLWAMGDPRAPIPPLDFGCRCQIAYRAKPATAAAQVLDVADGQVVTKPEEPARLWLDANVPEWKSIARAGKTDLAKIRKAARAEGITMEIANMIAIVVRAFGIP